ncbi:hypothetical protein G4O51_03880 [Candidatus Bathyarchaeota archaeon A05DMB-2]|jgi:DNA-directed RNA polymerase subunit RPC12/RpoP|nr:hypothetical protein [Candidatus Bathyarchaeota archaeon A05DMB-2]
MERSISSIKFDAESSLVTEIHESSKCSICGEEYETPLFTVVSSGYLIAEYYACPHCLSKVHHTKRQKRIISVEEDEEEAEAAKEELERTEEVEVAEPEPVKLEVKTETEEASSSACAHNFGYLKQRPKNTPIPEECFICNKMIECMS